MAIDYDKLDRERASFHDFQIRERALMMAQVDWHADRIADDQIMARAAQYAAFLSGHPTCAVSTEPAMASAASPSP